jgi:hypothetical protein
MKNTIIMLLVFAISMSVTLTVNAKDVEVVFIEVEIYSIPASKELTDLDSEFKGAILEESPNTLINVGDYTTMEVGSQFSETEDNDMFNIYFKVDQAGKYFDVDFQLNNESNQRISQLKDNPLDSQLVISASINGNTKLVKIKTTKFDNKELALIFSSDKSNLITKDELAKQVAKCYLAHKRVRTDLYKNGGAEMYQELIDSLVGKSRRFKFIRNIEVRSSGTPVPASTGRGMSSLQGKRYCSSIDEKLLKINK